MNLIKKWFKHDNDSGGTHVPVRRDRARPLLARWGGRHRLSDWFDELDRDPLALMRDAWSMFDRMHSLLNEFNVEWPAIDMSEDDKELTLRMDVPGIDVENLDVEVSGNVLTVRGSRDEEREDRRLHRRERVSGRFVRSVTLPSYVDPAALIARYDKGVLTITVPRVAGKGPRRITVTHN